MVIAKVFGGLGNQLFIYAAARSLSLQLNTELYLDTRSGFLNDPYKRQFELDKFNVVYKEAGLLQSFQFPFGRLVQAVLRRSSFLRSALPFHYIYETDFTKFSALYFQVNSNRNIYLEGYWQCAKYFNAYKDKILKDLELVCEISGQTRDIQKKILQRPNAVCLHARRMYMAPNDESAKVDPENYERSVNASYYQKGVEKILTKFPDAHFYCFGDYPEWLKDNVQFKGSPITIVNHNQYHNNLGHEDFWLMMQCRHFVISNSTFSWWAAYINNYSEQRMVIAPETNNWENKDILEGTNFKN